MWFGMSDVGIVKGESEEHGMESHEVCDSNNIQVHFRLGEESMGHMKLLLSKGGFLIRGQVGRVRAGLSGVWRLEVWGQSQDLKPVLGVQTLGTSEVFVVHISRNISPNEVLECGFLNHATIAEFLKPSLWVVLMHA